MKNRMREQMEKKKVILFGIGNNGRSIMDACGKYDAFFEVAAVADNRSELTEYAGVEVISAQLVEQLHISPSRIRYVEYPLPFLEQAFWKRYREELEGGRKCGSDELRQVMEYASANGVRMYCYPFYDAYMDQDMPVCYDEERSLYYVSFKKI